MSSWLRLLMLGVALTAMTAACAQGEDAVPISGSALSVGPAEYEVVVGCYGTVRVEVYEGPDEVELRGYGKDKIDGDCASTAMVTLDSPLGNRRLVDGKTGQTVPVAPAAD